MKYKTYLYEPVTGRDEKKFVNDCLDSNWISSKGKYIKKFDNWTYLKSLDIIDQKKNEYLFKNIRRVFSRFLKNYYKRKGYKEGKLGFLIALLAGLFPLVSYLRAEIKKTLN